MISARLFLTLPLILTAVSGCSTTPRDLRASLAAPAKNDDVYFRDFAVCKLMVDRGMTGHFRDSALASSGAAAGTVVGAGAAGYAIGIGVANTVTGAVASTFGQTAAVGSTAAASTVAVAAPVIGIAVSFGVSRAIRHSREKKVKLALSSCLQEYGYATAKWAPYRAGSGSRLGALPRDPAISPNQVAAPVASAAEPPAPAAPLSPGQP